MEDKAKLSLFNLILSLRGLLIHCETNSCQLILKTLIGGYKKVMSYPETL